MNERKTHKVEAKKNKVGDLMAFVYWARVEKIQSDEVLEVKDVDTGTVFLVQGKALIEKGFSADQHHETEKITKTAAAELLISSHNRPLTVCFIKADGTERILRGRLIQAEPLLGRSMVEDLETKDANKVRQVDHRTIKFLIVDGIRYEVK